MSRAFRGMLVFLSRLYMTARSVLTCFRELGLSSKIICLKAKASGTRFTNIRISCSINFHLTIISFISQSGIYLGPIILFAGKQVDPELLEAWPEAGWIANETGYNRAESWEAELKWFLENAPIPAASGPDSHNALDSDGHDSRYGDGAAELLGKHGWDMIIYPGNESFNISALDAKGGPHNKFKKLLRQDLNRYNTV